MTNRLDQLERAGLVRRLPDPSDRRGIQVELTSDGLAAWKRAAAVQAAKESIISAALTEPERESLNVLLRRIMIAFEQRERDP